MAVDMRSLELKVPPPIVAVVVALAMGSVSRLAASGEALPVARLLLVVGAAAAGAAFSMAGALAFRRARTTVNPLKPESTSSLVVSGVYKLTRNPMYVGLLLLLVAWAAFLWSIWALPGPLAFAAYVGRFQIVPEEKVLTGLFGAGYEAYKVRVRRWL